MIENSYDRADMGRGGSLLLLLARPIHPARRAGREAEAQEMNDGPHSLLLSAVSICCERKWEKQTEKNIVAEITRSVKSI